jgi:hypothetical protein
MVLGNMKTSLIYAHAYNGAGKNERRYEHQNLIDAYRTLVTSSKRIDLFVEDAARNNIPYDSSLIQNLRKGLEGIGEIITSFLVQKENSQNRRETEAIAA